MTNNYVLNKELLGFEKGTKLAYFADKTNTKDDVFRLQLQGINVIEFRRDFIEKGIRDLFLDELDYIKNEEKKKFLEDLKLIETDIAFNREMKIDDILMRLNELFEKVKGEMT